MTGRRNSKKNNRYDAFLITTAVAFGAIVTAHYWAIVTIAVTLIGLAYVAGRHSRHVPPGRTALPKPRPAPKKRRIHTVKISAECAGNDHLICTDKRCQCSRCDHPALKSYPLPADRIPATPAGHPDTPPF
jgi:hypothetical protein